MGVGHRRSYCQEPERNEYSPVSGFFSEMIPANWRLRSRAASSQGSGCGYIRRFGGPPGPVSFAFGQCTVAPERGLPFKILSRNRDQRQQKVNRSAGTGLECGAKKINPLLAVIFADRLEFTGPAVQLRHGQSHKPIGFKQLQAAANGACGKSHRKSARISRFIRPGLSGCAPAPCAPICPERRAG